jgi:hypothetical protein
MTPPANRASGFIVQTFLSILDLFSPTEIGIEKAHHERRLAAHSGKQKNRDVRPHGLHLTPDRNAACTRQVVFQEDAIDWLLSKQIKGLGCAGCRRDFTSDSFELARRGLWALRLPSRLAKARCHPEITPNFLFVF